VSEETFAEESREVSQVQLATPLVAMVVHDTLPPAALDWDVISEEKTRAFLQYHAELRATFKSFWEKGIRR
jgi:hypothetical protein